MHARMRACARPHMNARMRARSRRHAHTQACTHARTQTRTQATEEKVPPEFAFSVTTTNALSVSKRGRKLSKLLKTIGLPGGTQGLPNNLAERSLGCMAPHLNCQVGQRGEFCQPAQARLRTCKRWLPTLATHSGPPVGAQGLPNNLAERA